MPNRIVEPLGGGAYRERDTTDAAKESQNTRRWPSETLRTTAAIGANANTIMAFGGTAGGPGVLPTVLKGRVLGMFVALNGFVVAGDVRIIPQLNNVELTDLQVTLTAANPVAPPKTFMFARPIAFKVNESVSVRVRSSSDLNPAGTLTPSVWLLVEWDPE